MSSSKVSLWLAVALVASIFAPAAVAGMSAAIAFQSNLQKIDPAVFAPAPQYKADATGVGQGNLAAPTASSGTASPAFAGLTVAVVKLKDLASDTWSAQGHDFVVRSLQQLATRTQAQIVQVVQSRGGVVLNQFWLTNSLLIAADPTTIREIAQYPLVQEIHANYVISLPPEVESPTQQPSQGPYEWNIEKVRAPDAWALGITGTGVRVCVTDTGLDVTHPDVGPRLFTTSPGDPYYPGGWMEFDGNGNPVYSQPHDSWIHGTHVSGTIAGDSLGGTAIGVAPGAWLMEGLALPGGSGTFAEVVAGMQWCVSPFDRDGNPTPPAHVQSMSWGASGLYPELLDPTKNSLLAGIIPVAAAGNEGEGTIRTPGAIWGIFAAGATDINDNVAGFSSGMTVNWPSPPTDWPFFNMYPSTYIKPDFSAPGVNVRSTVPGGGYENLDGTSMATPHISATVALMIQASGFSLTPEQAYTNLVNSVVDMGQPGQDDRYGYGRLDTYRAVLLSLVANTGVKGTVYDSASSAPLKDVRVTATELGAYTTTNENGTFKMGLPEGSYNISFQKFGYFDQTIPIIVRLYNGTVQGYVNDSVGSPIVGAAVTIVQANVTVYTDGTGFYSASVKAGRYDMMASAAGYVPGNASVDIPENDTAWANFTLYPATPAILTGYVYDLGTGLPLANAVVWAEGPNIYANVTDANGLYQIVINQWDAGLYHVGAFLGGYWPDHYNVTVYPGTTTYADFYDSPSGSTNVAIYQDWQGELAALFGANGWNAYDYQNWDAVDLFWSLSAFPVVYWSGFSDLNNTNHPTSLTFAEITFLAQDLGVSIIFGDSYNGWPYGIELLNLYQGDPGSRNFDFATGNVYFTITANHPIFSGVGGVNDTVYVINQTSSDDGDHTWFSSYTGTQLAVVGTDTTGVLGDGVAVRDMPGGTEWVLLGSLAPQFWTHVSNDWTSNAMQIAVNSVNFGAANSWALGMGSHVLGSLPKVPSAAKGPTAAAPPIAPLVYVNLTVYLVRMPSGFVSGTVTDTSGVAVEGVKVSAASTPVFTYTDVSGLYTVELPVGDWTIVAKKFGYQTGSAPVTVVADETTTLDFVLVPQRRAGIMYDDTGNPLQQVLESTDKFAVMQFAGNWDDLIAQTPNLDLIVLNAQYGGIFPSQGQFLNLLAAADASGVGIMFLDNIYGYNSPYGFYAPWGLSLLTQYTGDPSSRSEIPYCVGFAYQEITARHGITKGYNPGDFPAIESVSTCYPFSWFGGFSGTTVGRVWAGYGTPQSLYGENLAYKITPAGARWALLASYGAIFGYESYWSNDAKQIIINAAIWASTNPLQMSINPTSGTVGSVVTFAGSGAPANAPLVAWFDEIAVDTLNADGTGGFSGSLTVPEDVYGSHSISVTTVDENYAGEQTFTMEPSLVLTPSSGPPDSAVAVAGHGYPAGVFVDLDFSGLPTGKGYTAADGSFNGMIIVPSVSGGDYMVTGRNLDTGATASATFRVIEEIALDVQASVGTLHFPGEVVDFLILVTIRGDMASATITATLWYPNGTSEDLPTMEVAVGLYKATYTLPGDAPTGTYGLVAQATVSETYRMGEGAGLATFLVSPTLTTQNAMITSIEGTVATIQTDTGQIRVDLTAVKAQITSVQGTVATISSDIGTMQASLAALDAKITAIQGSVATVQTSLGAVQVSLDSLNAKITALQGDVATIETSLGSTTAKVSDLQTTGGTLSMSAASIAAVFSVIATVVGIMSWRASRRPKEP